MKEGNPYCTYWGFNYGGEILRRTDIRLLSLCFCIQQQLWDDGLKCNLCQNGNQKCDELFELYFEVTKNWDFEKHIASGSSYCLPYYIANHGSYFVITDFFAIPLVRFSNVFDVRIMRPTDYVLPVGVPLSIGHDPAYDGLKGFARLLPDNWLPDEPEAVVWRVLLCCALDICEEVDHRIRISRANTRPLEDWACEWSMETNHPFAEYKKDE